VAERDDLPTDVASGKGVRRLRWNICGVFIHQYVPRRRRTAISSTHALAIIDLKLCVYFVDAFLCYRESNKTPKTYINLVSKLFT